MKTKSGSGKLIIVLCLVAITIGIAVSVYFIADIGIIMSEEDTVFRARLEEYKLEMQAYFSKKLVYERSFDISEINVENGEEIDISEIIPSMWEEDKEILVIKDGELRIKTKASKGKIKAAIAAQIEQLEE